MLGGGCYGWLLWHDVEHTARRAWGSTELRNVSEMVKNDVEVVVRGPDGAAGRHSGVRVAVRRE